MRFSLSPRVCLRHAVLPPVDAAHCAHAAALLSEAAEARNANTAADAGVDAAATRMRALALRSAPQLATAPLGRRGVWCAPLGAYIARDMGQPEPAIGAAVRHATKDEI